MHLRDGDWVWLVGMLGVSVAAHLGTWLMLGLIPSRDVLLAELSEIDIEVLEPELMETPPEEEVVEDAEPEVPEPPPPEPERAPPPAEEEPPPPEEAPPPAEEFLDMTGTVLTGSAGSGGFAIRQGTGEDREGPIAPPRNNTGRRVRGTPGGTPGGTGTTPGAPVVAVADLSRRPSPPPQGDVVRLMQQYYPRQARAQGIEGFAQVRLRINPSGSVRVLSTVAELGDHGFGSACSRALREAGSWRPPLSRSGQPVATVVTFRCTFEVRY